MFEKRPAVFNPAGKTELSLTMNRIGEWIDGGYSLNYSFYAPGEIEGGYEATISGVVDEYWSAGNAVIGRKLRVHVKVTTDLSRRDMEGGILGGGQFYDDYVDIELNLEPEQVRDIVYELRLSEKRQVSVSGHAISERIFRVTRFGLSEPRPDG